MHHEIEVKLKVNSHRPVLTSLCQCRAKFIDEYVQIDSYFDAGRGKKSLKNCALRIRQQSGKKPVNLLTYKGPATWTRTKSRSEIELQIEDAAKMTAILEALGFHKAVSYKKKRDVWELDNCEIAIDRLPHIGNFVEIEGPDEDTIAAVERKLGLDKIPAVKKSYRCLVTEYYAKHLPSPKFKI